MELDREEEAVLPSFVLQNCSQDASVGSLALSGAGIEDEEVVCSVDARGSDEVDGIVCSNCNRNQAWIGEVGMRKWELGI